MQQAPPTEETQNLLARLSQRPGVQSTLILSRDTGAIVKSSGLIIPSEKEEKEAEEDKEGAYVNDDNVDAPKRGSKNAETVARAVYGFFKSAGGMVEELNGVNDEAKLLRLRTKKNEMVVVPDAKFLLVVIHDTPPA